MMTGKMPRFFAAGIMILAWLAAGPTCRASLIDTSPQMIDGWTISWPSAIELSVIQDVTNPAQVDLVKSATFTAPQQGFQISFAPTPGQTQTADLFDLIGETITNDTGKPFGDFSFILLNTGTPPATATLTNVFALPSGSGYDYTNESTSSNDTEADYTGTQNVGVTTSWGGTTSNDKLVISAPSGSTFVLKELSEPQIPIIPEPGSLGLLLFGIATMCKRRSRKFEPVNGLTPPPALC